MTSPANELRQAAALLRERTEAAAADDLCRPPWKFAYCWLDIDAVLCAEGHVLADFGQEDADKAKARYVATMHPGVGLLLADLLDRAADYADHRIEELAVARAILGAAAQPAGGPA